MRNRTGLAVAAILACGLAPAAPALAVSLEPLPPGATPPDWAVKPTPDQTAHVYPELANDLGLGGRVVLGCRIDSRGAVERCRIRAETPPGLAFGRAALRLAPTFRFRPAITLAGAVPSMVNIPIRFVPPPDDLRRAIPFMTLLAALATGLAWRRRRPATAAASEPPGRSPAPERYWGW